MSTRSISWCKNGRYVRLTTLPPSCAVVTKSGSLNFLEPSGPVQACNGTDLPYTRFNINIYIYIYIYIYIVHTVCLRVLYVCYKRGWLLFLNTAWIIGCITEAECVYSAVRIDPFEKPQFRRTLWRRSGTLQPIALSYAAIAPMSALWTSSSFGIDHWVLAPFPNSCRFRTKFDSMPKRPWLAHCDRPTCVS